MPSAQNGFGQNVPGDASYEESLADFLQYVFAYYVASVLALMRGEHDVENELRNGDAVRILRALWKARQELAARAEHAPTLSFGYDPQNALLWFKKEELTRLLLRETPAKQQTAELMEREEEVFSTFYWTKPFYTYTTRFAGDPTFQEWAPLPMPAEAKQGRSPFDALPFDRQRDLLQYRDENWPEDFTLRHDGPIAYQGVVLNGYHHDVAVIGVRTDSDTRKYLARAAAKNKRTEPARFAFFQPYTRYLLLRGENVSYTIKSDETREGFIWMEDNGTKYPTIRKLEDHFLKAHPMLPLQEW